jgi:hypothetical protein
MCPVRAIRVAYTGELGLGTAPPDRDSAAICWDLLMKAGEKHGLKLVGARAQNWLRQEKSYRAFGNELGRDATPLGGRPGPLRRPDQGLPAARKRCSRTGIRVEMRDPADRRSGGRRPLGQGGAAA